MVTRRQAVFALVSGVLAPLASFAQQPDRVHRIGFLGARSRSTLANPDVYYDVWLGAMRNLGYIEGKNLVIEWRFADGKFERLPALAAELVAMKPDVIVTHALPPSQALKQATSTIPIVFAAMVDPVGSGVVTSFARPGGNITGPSSMATDVSAKRLELLKELIPGLFRVALFINPLVPIHATIFKITEDAAKALSVRVLSVEARNPEEIELGFATLARERVNAIIVADDAVFAGQQRLMVELALKNRMPSMFPYRENVEAGGLVCYGLSLLDSYRHAATYVDKILKGAKPGELPIEQPTKLDLIINLKTAKALGLKIPPTVLLRADRIIT